MCYFQGAKCYSSDFIAYDTICDTWYKLQQPTPESVGGDLSRYGHLAVSFGLSYGIILNSILNFNFIGWNYWFGHYIVWYLVSSYRYSLLSDIVDMKFKVETWCTFLRSWSWWWIPSTITTVRNVGFRRLRWSTKERCVGLRGWRLHVIVYQRALLDGHARSQMRLE